MNHPNQDPYNYKGQPWGKPYPNPYEPNPHEPWGKKQLPPIPKPVTITDLFPRIDRWGIGYMPLLEDLLQIAKEKPSYPPYDIIDHKNDTTVVSVAVAGFAKKEIEITLHEGTLKVEGKKKLKKEEGEVVYQGIAARDFTLTFALAEYYEVQSAELTDGMLNVTLFKNVPEEKKPKVIDIK